MDRLHHLAQEAATSGDLKQARDFAGKLEAIYRARPDLDWHRDRFAERRDEQFDAAALLALAEAELVAPSTLPPCARSRPPPARSLR